MKGKLGLLAGVLALTAAPLWAEEMITEYLNHTPGTLTGSVVSSSPQSVVITADVGQQQTFAIDSRSVVPDELPPGKRVRVQFRLLDSGTYRAQRITPLESWEEMDRASTPIRAEGGSSTSEETAVSETQTEYNQTNQTTTTTTTETSTQQESSAPSATSSESYERTEGTGTQVTSEDRLPTTASSLPLVALIAFLALGLSGALWLRRRLRRV
jgi:thiol:disulfide interchange protein